MAFRRRIAQSFSRIWEINSSRSSSPSSSKTLTKSAAPGPVFQGFIPRFTQRRPIFQSASSQGPRLVTIGDGVTQKLKTLNIVYDRLRLDGLAPPAAGSEAEGVSVGVVKKLLKLSQLESVKSKLRNISKNSIPYEEYVQICTEACSSRGQGLEIAQMLDECGSVVVFGNGVFLKPQQVMKVVEGLIDEPSAAGFTAEGELAEMEKRKAAIDREAESRVRREIWTGLGFFFVQTLGFMRLTFWELSWDVMEPICFYVTSFYCMVGCAFFVRTSKEPSYEGFFQSRLGAKRKRLMKIQNFDMGRYEQLRKACHRRACSCSSGIN